MLEFLLPTRYYTVKNADHVTELESTFPSMYRSRYRLDVDHMLSVVYSSVDDLFHFIQLDNEEAEDDSDIDEFFHYM